MDGVTAKTKATVEGVKKDARKRRKRKSERPSSRVMGYVRRGEAKRPRGCARIRSVSTRICFVSLRNGGSRRAEPNPQQLDGHDSAQPGKRWEG